MLHNIHAFLTILFSYIIKFELWNDVHVYNWQCPVPKRFESLDREIARKPEYKM